MRKITKLLREVLSLCLIACMMVPAVPLEAEENFAASSVPGYEMKFSENDFFELMGNADGSIAVLDKAGGFVYESNPQTEDELAVGINMTNLKSQLYITWVDREGNVTTKNSATDCVNQDGLSYSSIEGGVRYTYNFKNVGITIPVDYCLGERGLTASIALADIQEDSENTGCYLINIGLLPFFGAQDTSSSGYILVPDGSGALIHFNNDKASYGAYSQYVYGRDTALVTEEITEEEETARLPVFGITNGENGYLAVISQGDTNASVNALTSGTLNSYNNVYASFSYRAFTRATFLQGNTYAHDGKGDSSVSLTLSGVVPSIPSYSVEYLLLSKEDLTYVDMAKAYRAWLAEDKGMVLGEEESGAPMYIKLLGGLKVDEYVLGVKTSALKPLTTFRQAEEILSGLKDLGVEQLAVEYAGWQKGGMESKIPEKITFEGKLGGKRAYGHLAEFAGANQIALFMDFDFVNLYESGNGYSSNSDAAQTVGATPAFQYTYDRNLRRKETEGRWKLLTPVKVREAVSAMLEKSDRLRGAGLSLSTLGNTVYSDYAGKKNGMDRSDARGVWEELFRDARENFGSVMTDNGNAYTFPYVTHIYDVPLESSGYDLEDESVPFYQIVLHGYVSYSTQPLNLSAEPWKMVLKAVETGSSLSACLMYADTEALIGTKYDDYFSSHYATWAETLAEYYGRTRDVLNLVAQAQIESHGQAAPGVYRTVYSNGVSVYVNYNAEAAELDGVTVPAEDFIYISGGRGE